MHPTKPPYSEQNVFLMLRCGFNQSATMLPLTIVIRRLCIFPILSAALLALNLAGTARAQSAPTPLACPAMLQHTFLRLQDEKPQELCQYAGKVLLVVNTASFCGFTSQYEGLEALSTKYKDRGLVVLGFPSNDFFQEFENSEDTAKVCYLNYVVTFPMLNKSSVKGASANPFFQSLIQATGKPPKWNFHKYLIAKDGKSVTAYVSSVTPEQLDATIQTMLAAP